MTDPTVYTAACGCRQTESGRHLPCFDHGALPTPDPDPGPTRWFWAHDRTPA